MPRRRVLEEATFVTLSHPGRRVVDAAREAGAEVVVRTKDGREVVGQIADEQAERIVRAAEHDEDLLVMTASQELGTSETAQLLGISDTRVKQLFDANAIPARRVGRDRRARVEDVTAFKLERERRADIAPVFGGDDELELAGNDDFAGTP